MNMKYFYVKTIILHKCFFYSFQFILCYTSVVLPTDDKYFHTAHINDISSGASHSPTSSPRAAPISLLLWRIHISICFCR